MINELSLKSDLVLVILMAFWPKTHHDTVIVLDGRENGLGEWMLQVAVIYLPRYFLNRSISKLNLQD